MSKKENPNMSIWSQVDKTDFNFTKKIDYGHLKGKTSITGQYFFKRATEVFGPIGQGWGYDILEERFDTELPLTTTEDGTVVYGKTHTLKIALWYMRDGGKYHVVNYGHTPYILKAKTGITVDREAPKKSLTDAIKKCLSMLGFSADIYLGEFEDQEYVRERMEAAEIEKADDKDAKRLELRNAYLEEIENNMRLLAEAKNINELNGLYKMIVRMSERRKDESTTKRAHKVATQRKAELEAEQEGEANE